MIKFHRQNEDGFCVYALISDFFSLGGMVEDIRDEDYKATQLSVFISVFKLIFHVEFRLGFRGDIHMAIRII